MFVLGEIVCYKMGFGGVNWGGWLPEQPKQKTNQITPPTPLLLLFLLDASAYERPCEGAGDGKRERDGFRRGREATGSKGQPLPLTTGQSDGVLCCQEGKRVGRGEEEEEV